MERSINTGQSSRKDAKPSSPEFAAIRGREIPRIAYDPAMVEPPPPESAERRRDALRAFMLRRGIKSVNDWAKRAGVSESSIRAFLKGESRSLNLRSYERLADVEGAEVSELTGETTPSGTYDELETNRSLRHRGYGEMLKVALVRQIQPGSAHQQKGATVWNLPRALVDEHFAGAESDLCVMIVGDSSNAPELRPGDPILVATTGFDIAPDWYVVDDGAAQVIVYASVEPMTDPPILRIERLNSADVHMVPLSEARPKIRGRVLIKLTPQVPRSPGQIRGAA